MPDFCVFFNAGLARHNSLSGFYQPGNYQVLDGRFEQLPPVCALRWCLDCKLFVCFNLFSRDVMCNVCSCVRHTACLFGRGTFCGMEYYIKVVNGCAA